MAIFVDLPKRWLGRQCFSTIDTGSALSPVNPKRAKEVFPFLAFFAASGRCSIRLGWEGHGGLVLLLLWWYVDGDFCRSSEKVIGTSVFWYYWYRQRPIACQFPRPRSSPSPLTSALPTPLLCLLGSSGALSVQVRLLSLAIAATIVSSIISKTTSDLLKLPSRASKAVADTSR